MAKDYAKLDACLTVRDLADEEAGCDEVLFGCALRKDDVEAFLADVRTLVETVYGGASFSELVACDQADEAMAAARARWRSDASQELVACAARIVEEASA